MSSCCLIEYAYPLKLNNNHFTNDIKAENMQIMWILLAHACNNIMQNALAYSNAFIQLDDFNNRWNASRFNFPWT